MAPAFHLCFFSRSGSCSHFFPPSFPHYLPGLPSQTLASPLTRDRVIVTSARNSEKAMNALNGSIQRGFAVEKINYYGEVSKKSLLDLTRKSQRIKEKEEDSVSPFALLSLLTSSDETCVSGASYLGS